MEIIFDVSNWSLLREKVIPEKNSQIEGFRCPNNEFHLNEKIIKIRNHTRQQNVYIFVVILSYYRLCIVSEFVYLVTSQSFLHIVE